MLIRRILTALALITGLAATGAPASASVAQAVSEQLQAGQAEARNATQGPCECIYQRGLDPMKQRPRIACSPVRTPVTIFIPTVQYGPDRALE